MKIWRDQGVFDESIEEYVKNRFDNNVITPGTEFMHELAVSLNFYVYSRMNKHPHWKNLKVGVKQGGAELGSPHIYKFPVYY